MSSGKSGIQAFKPNEEGSYFNAFASGAETLKNMEDAIQQCGINGENPVRPTERAGTPSLDRAEKKASEGRTQEKSAAKPAHAPVNISNEADDTKTEWLQTKPFKLGINFDADTQYNKDPKMPGCYEVEGMKGACHT